MNTALLKVSEEIDLIVSPPLYRYWLFLECSSGVHKGGINTVRSHPEVSFVGPPIHSFWRAL